MIAVVGATGNTGRAVVKELTRLGQAPTVSCAIPIKHARFWTSTPERSLPNLPTGRPWRKRLKA